MRKVLDLFFDILAPLSAALFIIYAIVVLQPHASYIKPAQAQPLILGPLVSFFATVTTAQVIVQPNPTRHSLQICNSGGTNALWVMPNANTVNTGAIVNPAANVGVPVPPVASNVQSCFAPPTSAPSLGQGWLGFSTTTPVTVLDWP